MLDYLINLDTELFLTLNGLHNPFWDSIMWFFSGKLTWLPLYLILILFLIRKYRWDTIWWLVAIALVVLIADQISSTIIKPMVERYRPSYDPMIKELVHTVNGHRGGRPYGFVSSHAANMFGIAVLLSYLYHNRWATTGLIIWATAVSYSRIYLGVHYPGDVICGAAIGIGAGIGVFFLTRWFINRINSKKGKP